MKYTLKSLLVLSCIMLMAGTTIEPITAQPAPTKKAKRGVNLGGWMVLEPWLTPSLFYRFLGKDEKTGAAFDTYTFCKHLGPELGNTVLKEHWKQWLTEDHIKTLASQGVEMLRLPIGDWTLDQYDVYVGCMNGAAERIHWLLDTASKYDLKVWIDMHAMQGSQNGFDNSGQAMGFEWTDDDTFHHWDIQSADWMGKWNVTAKKYDSFDYANINNSVRRCKEVLIRWGMHPAFAAFEPVNEPWENSDIDVLKDYYRQVRLLMQSYAPQAFFVMHDMFKFDMSLWNDLFDNKEKVAIDNHHYQAWTQMKTTEEFCADYAGAYNSTETEYEIWIGEWSLATDTCALWLEGFNDGKTQKRFTCKSVECPAADNYLQDKSVVVDFDRTAMSLPPYGAKPYSVYGINKGSCWTGSDDLSSQDIGMIGACAIQAFDQYVDAQFFWNFRTEIEDRWSYDTAYKNGWFGNTQSGPQNQPDVKEGERSFLQ